MVGVLALQGNYQMHSDILSYIGQDSIFVKKTSDLSKCKGLIIPGGESTVISKLMIRYDLLDSIKKFSNTKSIFGTCAGLILMTNYKCDNIDSLNILNMDVDRNAWGSQIDSFTENIEVDLGDVKNDFKATFIRAPKIKKISNSITVLSKINKNPVMIREGRHIATTFHPEMHGDPLIHKYFLKIINENE